MSEEEVPSFTKPKVATIIVLTVMIAALIMHRVLWEYAGWSINYVFRSETARMIGLGVIIPIAVLTLTIVGAKIYDQSEYITLIFGIIITSIGGILILVTAFQIVNSIGDLISHLGYIPNVSGFYIAYIILATAGVGMSVLILVGGIDLIKYYNRTTL